MAKFDSMCDNCGNSTVSGKHWHTGHYLCLKCFSEWDKRDKEVREGFRKEMTGENVIKGDIVEKKRGQMKLF